MRDQLKKIQTAANQYEIYRDSILPVARQTVEASRAAYEANTGGFLQLITARRTLQDAESAALNHLANYQVALAELDAIIGEFRRIKSEIIIIHLICASLLIGVVASCSKSTSPTEKTLYTCSMHPQVIQDHPGDCPICGMKLVPMRKETASAAKIGRRVPS